MWRILLILAQQQQHRLTLTKSALFLIELFIGNFETKISFLHLSFTICVYAYLVRAGVDTGRGYGTARGNRNSPNKGAGTKKLNQRAKDQKPKVNKMPTDNFYDEEESVSVF